MTDFRTQEINIGRQAAWPDTPVDGSDPLFDQEADTQDPSLQHGEFPGPFLPESTPFPTPGLVERQQHSSDLDLPLTPRQGHFLKTFQDAIREVYQGTATHQGRQIDLERLRTELRALSPETIELVVAFYEDPDCVDKEILKNRREFDELRGRNTERINSAKEQLTAYSDDFAEAADVTSLDNSRLISAITRTPEAQLPPDALDLTDVEVRIKPPSRWRSLGRYTPLHRASRISAPRAISREIARRAGIIDVNEALGGTRTLSANYRQLGARPEVPLVGDENSPEIAAVNGHETSAVGDEHSSADNNGVFDGEVVDDEVPAAEESSSADPGLGQRKQAVLDQLREQITRPVIDQTSTQDRTG